MSALRSVFKSASVWALSQCWSAVNQVARSFARIRPGYAVDLGVRTISVGNVQAGGSGKTPVVRAVAQECIDRGLRVCILSRGYRGSWENNPHALVPKERSRDTVSARDCGDEVALLREHLPRAWFGVGSDRVAAFRLAEKALSLNEKFDCVILDDGLQHWKIRRDLDLITVTSDRAHERVFRESLRNAVWERSRSHAEYPRTLWVWTKGESSPFRDLSIGEAFDQSVCKVRYRLVISGRLADRKEDRVWSVCGVADPRSFHAGLINAGLKLDRRIDFDDHHHYERSELEEIFSAAKSAGAFLITTGKDSVKWQELGFEDFSRAEPVLEWESGRENWENALWR